MTAFAAAIMNMLELQHDAFYELARQYDPHGEYHFVGEVDYHLLRDEKPYEGLSSHRAALVAVFDRLAKDSMENRESAGHEWCGACCWSVYDKSMDRYVVMLVSATD